MWIGFSHTAILFACVCVERERERERFNTKVYRNHKWAKTNIHSAQESLLWGFSFTHGKNQTAILQWTKIVKSPLITSSVGEELSTLARFSPLLGSPSWLSPLFGSSSNSSSLYCPSNCRGLGGCWPEKKILACQKLPISLIVYLL